MKGIDLLGRLFWVVYGIVLGFLLVIFVILVMVPTTWSWKAFLVEQGLLTSVIGVSGVIIASVIALGSLVFVNRQTQTYAWRRDQALADITDIYVPLCEEIDKLVAELDDYRPSWGEPQQWSRIQSSYLETRLKLRNKQLYRRLVDFYNGFNDCRDAIGKAIGLVKAIARLTIEENLSTPLSNLPPANKELILRDMPISMDYERYIYAGFLKDRSIRESSKLKFRGDENYLIKWALNQNLKGKSYWPSIELSQNNWR